MLNRFRRKGRDSSSTVRTSLFCYLPHGVLATCYPKSGNVEPGIQHDSDTWVNLEENRVNPFFKQTARWPGVELNLKQIQSFENAHFSQALVTVVRAECGTKLLQLTAYSFDSSLKFQCSGSTENVIEVRVNCGLLWMIRVAFCLVSKQWRF